MGHEKRQHRLPGRRRPRHAADGLLRRFAHALSLRLVYGHPDHGGLPRHLPRLSAILERNGIQIDALQQRYCCHQVFSLARSPQIDSIFSVLFHRASISPFLHQIKIMELFAYLAELDPTQQKAVSEWNTEQTAIIQQMHDFLIDHVQQRYTIEELSHRFLINTSTLKSAFKAVYGMPIAAYMKEYRMQQAMIMLQDPALSIAEIAARLGYESQSKFARAFKDCAGILPRDYRKTLQTKQ